MHKTLIASLAAALLLLAAPAANADQARFEECEAKLLLAADAGMIHGVALDERGVLQVMFNEDVWNAATYRTKDGMLRVFNCWFFQGEEDTFVDIDVRSHRTNKHLGGFYDGKTVVE